MGYFSLYLYHLQFSSSESYRFQGIDISLSCLNLFLCILLFFFFFFFYYPHGILKFLGPGLNLSCSCDICHSCSNSGSLTHCTSPRIEIAPQQWPMTLQRQCPILNSLTVPQEELLCFTLFSRDCKWHYFLAFSDNSLLMHTKAMDICILSWTLHLT